MSNKQDTVYTHEEVNKHNKEGDAWIIVNNLVFDITNFMKLHPGGMQPLLEYMGKDATEIFYSLHRAEVIT
eukprot:UN13539